MSPCVSLYSSLRIALLLVTNVAAAVSSINRTNAPRHIFFMKAPTSSPLPNCTWSMVQQDPLSFSQRNMQDMLNALNITDDYPQNPMMKVGLTFQWELLDCFLSPHTCTTAQVQTGILNFLNAAVAIQTPVEITLDPIQFYYASNLWNWYDPKQPGYDPANIANVEWTGWSVKNATMISWRNWGSQFRLPTPQPNIASEQFISQTQTILFAVMTTIKTWYKKQTVENQQLLVGIKLGEEVDIGANFYFYPHGNEIYEHHNKSTDPEYGHDWSQGIAGGLQAQGYNMLQTLNIRAGGGPPTRHEITMGVRHYFTKIIKACTNAWPELQHNHLLVTHGGLVGDPLLIEWNSPMVEPAIPGYSSYDGPGKPMGQPGLKHALDSYAYSNNTFVIAEAACFECKTKEQWINYFTTVFNNPYGKVKYMRYYNIDPFLSAPGSLEGLREFVEGYSPGLK